MGGNPKLMTAQGAHRALLKIAAIEIDWLQGLITAEDAMRAVSAALNETSNQ
jgi:hypothetical protein